MKLPDQIRSTIELPRSIVQEIEETYGVFFHKLCNLPAGKIAADLLDESKVDEQIDVFLRATGLSHADLPRKRLLEIGSGYGVFLARCRRVYGLETYGVEPSSEGFEGSFEVGREILRCYDVDPLAMIDARGESLPFPNSSFDIVFSSNVLEHVSDPKAVLSEALRVLKTGGFLQITFPNYHSLFDGHYAVFHPPMIFGKTFFPWLIRYIYRRDDTFAKTIRTELNARSALRMINDLRMDYSFELLSLGEREFERRMGNLDFGEYAGLSKVKRMIRAAKQIGINHLVAKLFIKLKMWTPVIITIRKSEAKDAF